MGLILQGAEGVGYALQGVLDGMGEVVHGEDTPFGALAVVLDVADAVEHRVPHVEVAAGQVYLGTEGVLALGEFSFSHAPEEVQALLNGPVSPGADGRLDGVATVLFELLGSQLAHIGKALLYKLYGILIGLFKIVGAVVEPVAPVEAQPVDILLDSVHVFRILLGGVGVVHAQVAHAAETLGGTEIYSQRLAVAYMEIAVGLRRKTGVHLHAVTAVALREILLHKGVNKVSGSFVHLFHLLYLLMNHSTL